MTLMFPFRYADQIKTGDEVLVPENDVVIPFKVIKMSSFHMKGAHVPLPMEANIVVDGVLASCYPSYNHDLGHIGMMPIQMFPTLLEWIFCDDNGS